MRTPNRDRGLGHRGDVTAVGAVGPSNVDAGPNSEYGPMAVYGCAAARRGARARGGLRAGEGGPPRAGWAAGKGAGRGPEGRPDVAARGGGDGGTAAAGRLSAVSELHVRRFGVKMSGQNHSGHPSGDPFNQLQHLDGRAPRGVLPVGHLQLGYLVWVGRSGSEQDRGQPWREVEVGVCRRPPAPAPGGTQTHGGAAVGVDGDDGPASVGPRAADIDQGLDGTPRNEGATAVADKVWLLRHADWTGVGWLTKLWNELLNRNGGVHVPGYGTQFFPKIFSSVLSAEECWGWITRRILPSPRTNARRTHRRTSGGQWVAAVDTLVLELVMDAAAWLWLVYLAAASLVMVGLAAWLFLFAGARAARLSLGAARCLAEPGLLLMEAAATEAAGRMGASAAVPAALWWVARLHSARRTSGPRCRPIPDTRAGRAWMETSRELKETTSAILGSLLLVVMALLFRRLWAAAGVAAVLAALLWRWPGSEQRERWARVRLSLVLSDRRHDSVVVASWAASPWLVGAMRCLCGESRTAGRESLTGKTGARVDEPHNGWELKAKRWTAATRLQRLWRSTHSKRLGQELRKAVTEARARPPESATTGWAKMRWRQAMQARTDHAMQTMRARRREACQSGWSKLRDRRVSDDDVRREGLGPLLPLSLIHI